MTWSKNGIVSFWDLKTKKIIRELRSKNDFHELSINQYSKVLLTGYYKDKALLFDLTNLDLERELDENIQLVNTYLTNESNQFMVSSSEEGRHRLMQVKGGDGIKPLSLQKREIEIQKIITVDTETLQIAVWDNERVDGDKISLSLNGKWILRNHEIVKEKYEFEVNLIQNQINQLVFFAENLGSIPPNTSAVNIQYEGYNKTHIMRSNLDKSGCINFFIEK
jgi:WD40 repeat protein